MIKEQEIRRSVELRGVEETVKDIEKALTEGQIKPHECSLRGLFSSLVVDTSTGKPCGNSVLEQMRFNPRQPLQENLANYVSMGNFSHIIGQIFFNAILESYRLADFNIAPRFNVVPSNIISQSERFAGISNLGDASRAIGEAQEIPMASLNEDFLNTQIQLKKGLRVPITREALLSDRTGEVLNHCRAVGEAIGIAREVEAVTTLVNNAGSAGAEAYNWRGTAYAAYQSSNSALPFYKNLVASNGLVDHLSINSAYIVLAQIQDPFTKQPLPDVGTYDLICTPENRFVAEKIAHSLQFRGNSSQSNFATNVSEGSPVVPFNVVVSKYLYKYLKDNSLPTSTWFFGDTKKSLAFIRSLDITVEEALPGAGIAFTHDIISQFRVLKYESSAWWNPRYMAQCTA